MIDKHIETLNLLQNAIPNLLRGQDFHKSLELCLANIFEITKQQEFIELGDISTSLYSYCLKPNRNNNALCYEELAEILFNNMIEYTIPKTEIEEALAEKNTLAVMELFHKAKRKYVDYWKNRNEAIKNTNLKDDEHISKSGEGGEELLFLLAEQVLNLPQAICKMNLKTSGSMHFNGADGIHIGLTEDKSKLALYYSEVKIYKNVQDAIKNCLKSITPLLKKEDKELIELDLLNSYLDLGENVELEKKLKKYFNPNRVENSELTEVRGLCLIGFNENDYNGLDYKNNAQNIVPNIKNWISNFEKHKIENGIKNIRVNVFFIPMTCVDTFRDTFKNKIGV